MSWLDKKIEVVVSKKLTKKQLAVYLDTQNPLFNYNTEKGPTSYKNYTKDQLWDTLVRFSSKNVITGKVNDFVDKENQYTRLLKGKQVYFNETDRNNEEVENLDGIIDFVSYSVENKYFKVFIKPSKVRISHRFNNGSNFIILSEDSIDKLIKDGKAGEYTGYGYRTGLKTIQFD